MIEFGIGTALSFAQTLTRGRRVRAAAQRGLERAGERIADEIRAANSDVTGALDRSVRVDPGRNQSAIVIRAGGPETTKDGYDYALAVEFGTTKMPAEPFFFPTIRANLDAVDDEVGRAVGEALSD